MRVLAELLCTLITAMFLFGCEAYPVGSRPDANEVLPTVDANVGPGLSDVPSSVLDATETVPECVENEDCDDDEVCVENVCVPEENEDCTENGDCAEAHRCENGQCVPEDPGACVKDNDCADSEVCLEGVCAPASGDCPEECPDKYDNHCNGEGHHHHGRGNGYGHCRHHQH